MINRFNTGLLYKINNNNKVTNLDRLSSSCNEFEFTSEEKSKEIEDVKSGTPLNEIIETGLSNYSAGRYLKKKIMSRDNINRDVKNYL